MPALREEGRWTRKDQERKRKGAESLQRFSLKHFNYLTTAVRLCCTCGVRACGRGNTATAAAAPPIGHVKQAITNIYTVCNIINTNGRVPNQFAATIFFLVWKIEMKSFEQRRGEWREKGEGDQTRLRSRVAFYAIFPYKWTELCSPATLQRRCCCCCVQCAVILQLCQRFYL